MTFRIDTSKNSSFPLFRFFHKLFLRSFTSIRTLSLINCSLTDTEEDVRSQRPENHGPRGCRCCFESCCRLPLTLSHRNVVFESVGSRYFASSRRERGGVVAAIVRMVGHHTTTDLPPPLQGFNAVRLDYHPRPLPLFCCNETPPLTGFTDFSCVKDPLHRCSGYPLLRCGGQGWPKCTYSPPTSSTPATASHQLLQEVSSILEQKIRGISDEAALSETGKVLSVGLVTPLFI